MHQDKHSKKKKRRSGASAARDLVVGLVKTNRTPAPFWPDATAPEMVNSDKPGGADLIAAAVALWHARQCRKQERRQQIEEKKKEAPSEAKNDVSVAVARRGGGRVGLSKTCSLFKSPSSAATEEAVPASLFLQRLSSTAADISALEFCPAQTGNGARERDN